jgi:hypothetical protein
MGKTIQQNRTTFVRCLKDEQHPFCRIPANLFKLDGYQFAIMSHIISNADQWNIVKYEIAKRLGFPRKKFDKAWKSLIDQGYIKVKRIQGGYDYTIYEDLGSTSTMGGICEASSSTTGTTCKGGILTTINTNYYKEVTTTDDNICSQSQFNQLLELFPSEGTKQDGTTYKLKSKLKECKKAYTDYLNSNAMTHDEIMTALKIELNEKQLTGKIYFQIGLYRWIKDKLFEQYRGKKFEPAKLGYGQTML